MRTPQAMIAGALAAGFALNACGEREDAHIALNEADGRSVQRRELSESAAADAVRAAREATQATRRAVDEAKRTAQTAADQATNKVSDAMITTAVSAELAKDPALGATQIDVDTDAGRVALRGTASDEQARARAAQIASQVQGVESVDNHISVRPTD